MAWSKESSSKRGYGAKWQKLRLFILARDMHLCQCDQCGGGDKRLTPASEVNHKVSKAEARFKGWTQDQIDDPSNLEAVNAECHKRITAHQKGHRARPVIGVDGWPAPG